MNANIANIGRTIGPIMPRIGLKNGLRMRMLCATSLHVNRC